MYSSMLKAIFKRSKVFKFCRVIYIKIFLKIYITYTGRIFDNKISFLIVNAVFVNILRYCSFLRLECFKTKYGIRIKSISEAFYLLLLCQTC